MKYFFTWKSIIQLFSATFMGLFFLGCVPQVSNKLDDRIINPENDKLFLKNDMSKCPATLRETTVNLQTNFDDCTDPMKMQIVINNGFDTQMQIQDVIYDGLWKEDITNSLKRNLHLACGTKFSEQANIPTIDLRFKKLTSQIISIDQNHVTDKFNIVNLDSQLDYSSSANYVLEVAIGGTLFFKNLAYQKGLNIKNIGKQKATGSNYLVTVSTRNENSRLVNISILPENIPLYVQSNVDVMDMRTIILPIFTKEKIINYTLYSKSGEIIKKNKISSRDGTLADEPIDTSDKAIINMFAGTGISIGYFNNAIVGPYRWLIYDLSQKIIDESK